MTLKNLLDSAVAKGAGRIAMEWREGGTRCTRSYSELALRSQKIARFALDLPLKPRTFPAAIILDNCPQWVEICLALASIAVPVVPIDPKLRPAELVHVLGNSGSEAVFTDAAHFAILQQVLPDLPAIRNIVLVDGEENDAPTQLLGRSVADLESRMALCKAPVEESPREDDLASIIYTSGSTGFPKGVLLSHSNFIANADGTMDAIKAFNANDSFMIVLPLFHAFSFLTNLVLVLRVGARMQFVSNLRNIGEDLVYFRPTVLMAVPLLAEKLFGKIKTRMETHRWLLFCRALGLRGPCYDYVRRNLGGSLKLLVTGGAPCSPKTLTGMKRYKVPIVEGYGLSEASPVVSVTSLHKSRIGTIGLPLPNLEVRIAHPNEVGVGELQVRGPNVMRGYLNLPDETRDAFEDGWLRTGDLASQDADGYLTIRGRLKALIVNREGKNIYPEEVERCILRDKRLLDALVIGYRDQHEIGEKVGAIVVPNPECNLSDAEVRAIVQTQCGDLATYKHPRKLDIRREPLERTPTHKIKRNLYQGQLDSRE